MKKETNLKVTCCSSRQKVLGVVALGGLFVCGMFVGAAMNGNGGRRLKEIGMSEDQCWQIARKITEVAEGDAFAGCNGETCVAKLRELNEIYSKNCAGRTFEVEEPKPAPKVEDTSDKKTCEVIEDLLKHDLADENNNYPFGHKNNIVVYKKLVQNGCPENVEKYRALIQREQEILAALTGGMASENTQTCAEIERLLQEQVRYCDSAYDSECHINNAKIYANISERGCQENRQKYADLAAKELEIARALQDDKFSDYDREQISDTYKRIQMKQAAGEVLNKVQQLADPAIDFIIQAQKIIEE